jgi:hypothetical protein
MSGFDDATERAILNHVLTDPAWTPAATLYIGLSSTTPTDAGGNFTEPSTGSYARVSTAAADWDAATGTAPATKTNSATKTYPTATGDWVAGANLTHFGLFEALSGGTPIVCGALTTPKPVLSADVASFGPGTLVLKLGDPTDTFS